MSTKNPIEGLCPSFSFAISYVSESNEEFVERRDEGIINMKRVGHGLQPREGEGAGVVQLRRSVDLDFPKRPSVTYQDVCTVCEAGLFLSLFWTLGLTFTHSENLICESTIRECFPPKTP